MADEPGVDLYCKGSIGPLCQDALPTWLLNLAGDAIPWLTAIAGLCALAWACVRLVRLARYRTRQRTSDRRDRNVDATTGVTNSRGPMIP